MLSHDQAQDAAQAIVRLAVAAGADAADAVMTANTALDVSVRFGVLEDVNRSEYHRLTLRVFKGKRTANVSTSNISGWNFGMLVANAISMAAASPENVWAGLGDSDLLHRNPGDPVALGDDYHPSTADLLQLASESEAAAVSIAGVTNSEGSGVSAAQSTLALATSHGFTGCYTTTDYSLSTSVVAGDVADGMQRDNAYHSVRKFSDLESARDIGLRAGRRAVSRLRPVSVASGTMPVVFDPRIGNSLLEHLLEAIAGSAITRKSSFLANRLNRPVFRPGTVIRDDPTLAYGLRSRPFDGEGLPVSRTDIVRDGVLTTWLLDSSSARQLGMRPTGHASRKGGGIGVAAGNVRLEPGTSSVRELLSDIRTGVFVTELIGRGVNALTGQYSRGAAGFLISNGTICESITQFTISGNLTDMYANLVPANDLRLKYGIDVPTCRIDGMYIASL